MKTVIRYVATYVNKDGMRTLMAAQQGRNTYATAAKAQAWLDAVFTTSTNSPDTLRSIWGDNPRCEVRPCECYPGHFDPVGIYFDDDENPVCECCGESAGEGGALCPACAASR